MTDRDPLRLPFGVPAILIMLPFEGKLDVLVPADEHARRRAFAWLDSQPDLAALLEQARDVRRGDHDEVAQEGDDERVLVTTTYERWPDSEADLDLVSADWLRENGIQAEGGRITGWDVEQFPFDPEAAPGEPLYRPGPRFAPSLAEIELRLGESA